jgi:phosphatidylserine/phosphatidylglycerophosphate/cardiolipin synthase-like enzyme
MIEPLLELPSHLRERLARALDTGLVAPPYTEPAIRSALSTHDGVPSLCEALRRLDAGGISGPAVALALDVADRTAARAARPDLVWSGPEVPGLHARDTRRVYEELVAGARRSIWLSTFAYFDGPKAFKTLAGRMDEVQDLRVILLVNIGRRHGDTTASHELVVRFADRLWTKDWPGERRPDVFYDPRSLDPSGPAGVLHAKAVVVDDELAFVTSANLTEAAFERNIEAGVLSRDGALAASLARHFRVLIDRGLLRPLP